MRVLEWLAKACALLAGVLLTAITLMTCVSLIGRNTTGWTLVGDFELSGSCRRRRGGAVPAAVPGTGVGNIIVDFFTAQASRRHAATALDRLGALLLAAVMALLTWRTRWAG
jgi:hypothetical protein